MTTSVQQRVALIVAVLVLAGVVATLALRSGDDTETVALQTPTATATTTAAATQAPRSTTAPGATAARTQAPAAPTTRPAATPNLAVAEPPRAGTYRYEETSDGEKRNVDLEVADRGSGRQSEESEGVRADIIWSEQSKLIDKISFAEIGFSCDLEPDIVELRFPLRTGATWTQSGKCSNGPVSLSFKGEARVAEPAKKAVGGTTVDTWRILTKATATFKTPDGSFSETVEEDAYFAPAHGLYVRATDRTSGTDPSTGERVNEASTRQLLSLTPS